MEGGRSSVMEGWVTGLLEDVVMGGCVSNGYKVAHDRIFAT